MSTKKAWELAVVNIARDCFKGFPIGELIPFESPDFVIKNADEILGVEIVEYVRDQSETGSPKRHEEIIQNQLCNQVREKFESRHGEKLFVFCQSSVHNKLSDLDHTQREIIVDLLLEKIESSIPICFNTFKNVDIRWDIDEMLNQLISSISLMKVKEKSCWGFTQVDWIGATKKEIQSVINRKNVKVADYKRKCDKIWLIVVARGYRMSSIVDIKDILNEPFVSRFEKVLFLYQDEKTVFELRTVTLRGRNYDGN